MCPGMVRPVPPLVAFAACTFIWGTTWLAIKVGYAGLDPLWGASLRFFLASGLLGAFLLTRTQESPSSWRHAFVVLFVGTAMFGLDYGLIYWGEQFLASGLTAILFATMPLFVALFGSILLPMDQLTWRHGVGIGIGLAGLFFIFQPQLSLDHFTLWPMVAIVGAAAAAAGSNVVVRRWGHDLAPARLTAGAMLIGAFQLFLASLLLGESPHWPATGTTWASLLYLVVIGSVLAFLLYWDLLRTWGAHRSGLIVLLTPVVAVVSGYALQEHLTVAQWLGSSLVLGGVALALLRPRPLRLRAPAAATPP